MVHCVSQCRQNYENLPRIPLAIILIQSMTTVRSVAFTDFVYNSVIENASSIIWFLLLSVSQVGIHQGSILDIFPSISLPVINSTEVQYCLFG